MRRAAYALLLAANFAFPQNTITTLAGTDWVFPKQAKPAVETPFGGIWGVAIGPGGLPYFGDADNQRIFRLNADGTYRVVAGNGVAGFSGDGRPAFSASLNQPRGLSFDSQGNLYFVDSGNLRVRRVTPGGTITTIAGNGQAGFSGDDGPALSASLGAGASGTAVDTAGNVYVADAANRRVRQIIPGAPADAIRNEKRQDRNSAGARIQPALRGIVASGSVWYNCYTDMRFRFDPRKSKRLRANPRRGIGFEEVQELFSRPYWLDQRSDVPEQYRAIGWVGDRLYSVIFEVREDEEGEILHLVTLWRSTKEEVRLYEENS